MYSISTNTIEEQVFVDQIFTKFSPKKNNIYQFQKLPILLGVIQSHSIFQVLFTFWCGLQTITQK